MLSLLLTMLQEHFPPNRIVALLTPPLAALAGYIAAWVADTFPGLPPIDDAALTAIFIAGAGSVVGIAWKWLQGWQAYEARGGELDDEALLSLPTDIHEDDLEPDEEIAGQ